MDCGDLPAKKVICSPPPPAGPWPPAGRGPAAPSRPLVSPSCAESPPGPGRLPGQPQHAAAAGVEGGGAGAGSSRRVSLDQQLQLQVRAGWAGAGSSRRVSLGLQLQLQVRRADVCESQQHAVASACSRCKQEQTGFTGPRAASMQGPRNASMNAGPAGTIPCAVVQYLCYCLHCTVVQHLCYCHHSVPIPPPCPAPV